MFTRFKEKILIYLKSKNKNILVTRKLNAYIDKLIYARMSITEMAEYKKINSAPNSNYQTPVSQIRLLQLIVMLTQSKEILEVGTYKGFTAFSLASVGGKICHVVTCENNQENIVATRQLWEKFDISHQIDIQEGLAKDTMIKLGCAGKKFDFIYIDANKDQYIDYYRLALDLVHTGSVIAIDNALWAGLVAEEKTKYSHAKLINSLNHEIFSNNKNMPVLIPAWDGLLLIVIG